MNSSEISGIEDIEAKNQTIKDLENLLRSIDFEKICLDTAIIHICGGRAHPFERSSETSDIVRRIFTPLQNGEEIIFRDNCFKIGKQVFSIDEVCIFLWKAFGNKRKEIETVYNSLKEGFTTEPVLEEPIIDSTSQNKIPLSEKMLGIVALIREEVIATLIAARRS